MKKSYKIVPFLVLAILTNQAAAIPPPDLIITALQSAMQMLGVIVAFSLSAFFFIGDYIKALYYRGPKLFIFSVVLILVLILGGIFAYTNKNFQNFS